MWLQVAASCDNIGYEKGGAMTTQKVRIMATLSVDQHREFEKWRKRMGQDISGFAGLCIEVGLQAVARTVYPQEFITPEQLAAAAGVAQKRARKVSANAKKK